MAQVGIFIKLDKFILFTPRTAVGHVGKIVGRPVVDEVIQRCFRLIRERDRIKHNNSCFIQESSDFIRASASSSKRHVVFQLWCGAYSKKTFINVFAVICGVYSTEGGTLSSAPLYRVKAISGFVTSI